MARRSGLVAIGALVVAAVEITLLVLVGHLIGVAATLLLVLATTALGMLLVRREGVRAWRALREMASTAPGRPGGLAAGATGLVAAFLLVVPGFLTDVVGLVLLVPFVRRWALAGVAGAAVRRSPVAGDLFGPRRVRVRTGPAPRDAEAPGAGQPLEGEIVEPYPPAR